MCLQEAECDKLRMDIKYSAETKIADSLRQFQMEKSKFNAEVNTKVLLTLQSFQSVVCEYSL